MKLSKEDIGRRYAIAFYDYAVEQNVLEDVFNELQVLKVVVSETPEFAQVLTNPVLDLTEKQNILTLVKEKFSVTVQKYLQIVFDYSRMDDLGAIIDAFNAKYETENGFGHGTVTTAVKMTKAQMDELSKNYAKENGLNKFSVTNDVDDSILGGVVLRTNGMVIDGSIKTKLVSLKASLINKI